MANNGVTITINAETKEALSRVKEFFGAGSEGLERMSRAGEFLREIGGRIAGALTVGAVVEFTRETINAAEGLKILSREAGFSIKLLSGIREESIRTRDGFEGVSQSLVFFSRQLGQAVRMGGPMAKAFRDLLGPEGLASFASGGRGVDQVLVEVVSALNGMAEPTEKAALAAEVFGRGWRDALTALGGIHGELREGAITAEMAERAERFNVSLREMKARAEELFVALAQRLLPKLEELVNWLKGASAAGSGLAEDFTALGSVLAMSLTKGLVNALLDGAQLLGEGFIRLAGALTQKIDALLVGGINWVIGKINSSAVLSNLFGLAGGLKPVSLSDTEGQMARQIAAMREGAVLAKELVNGFFDTGIKGAQLSARAGRSRGGGGAGGGLMARGTGEQFGPNQPGAAPLSEESKALILEIERQYASAQGKIEALQEESRQEQEKVDRTIVTDLGKAEEEKLKIAEFYEKKITEVVRQQQEAELEIELAKVLGKRRILEQDPTKSELEKKADLLVSLGKENALIKENIALYEQRTRDESLTAEERMAASKQLQGLQQQRAENNLATGKLTRQGTFGGEFGNVLVGLKDQWGSWAKQAADGFKNVFTSAVQSISDGITGLIMGTKSWGQALNEIGTNIATSLVGAIVKMGVQWVATQLVLALAGKALMASSIAAMTPLAVAASAVWAAPAVLSAIATDGASAAAAPEEIFAAQGITLAGSIAQFEQGGFTGAAGGMVHPNEFVFSAPAVRRIGLGNLEAMHEGGRAGGGAGGAGANIHLAVLHNESQIPNWARSAEGERHVVDIVRRNWTRLT